jgi:hypothetical protein
MRELNRLVDALERGEIEKVVLTQRNQMRAVVVSLERFAELERRAAPRVGQPPVGLSVARSGRSQPGF